MQQPDRTAGLFRIVELDKSESPRATRIPIQRDKNTTDRSGLCKVVPNLVFCSVVRQVSDEKAIRHKLKLGGRAQPVESIGQDSSDLASLPTFDLVTLEHKHDLAILHQGD